MEIILHPRSPTLAWLRSLGELQKFNEIWVNDICQNRLLVYFWVHVKKSNVNSNHAKKLNVARVLAELQFSRKNFFSWRWGSFLQLSLQLSIWIFWAGCWLVSSLQLVRVRSSLPLLLVWPADSVMSQMSVMLKVWRLAPCYKTLQTPPFPLLLHT